MTSDALLSLLQRSAAGGATAIRIRTKLAPAGGPSDKVFPPACVTYSNGVPAPRPAHLGVGQASFHVRSRVVAAPACSRSR